MSLQKLILPENFLDLLPDLQNKTLKWESVLCSGTELNTSAKIKYYHSLHPSPLGSIVTFPGLGSNSKLDPLGKRFSYWALTHRYNVITVDTFMGNFMPIPSIAETQKYHYSELVSIMDKTIDFLAPHLSTNYSCAIGHCASASGLIDTFNTRAQKNKPINFTSTMLFAPWPCFDEKFLYSIDKLLKYTQDYDEPSERKDLKIAHFTFLVRMKHFVQEINIQPFQPQLMAQWGLKTTFISAKRDSVSNLENNTEKYNILREYNDKFSHIVLPGVKHDFSQITNNPNSIIELIKDQRTKRK